MIKERKIESIRFETKAVIYQNETGFKILAGVAYNADSGEMLRKRKTEIYSVKKDGRRWKIADWFKPILPAAVNNKKRKDEK